MKSLLSRTACIAATTLMFACPLPAAIAEELQSTSLTLEKTIQLVRDNNPALKAAVDEISAADARITQSRSAYFPQITATAGYTRLDPVSEMSFGGPTIQFMPYNNYDTKVTARATLLDFGRRGSNVDLAMTGKRTAEHSLEFARRELSWQSVQLFYGILFLRESITVEQKEIKALNKALEFTSKRYKAGSATRFDVLSTEVRIAAARSRMLDLEHALHRNELTLRRLTGLQGNTPLALQGSFAVTSPTPSSDSALLSQALQQRLELKLSRENESAAKQRRSLAMKQGLPVVTGSLSWGITNGFQPDIHENRKNFAGSLHLELPLFTGFRTSAEQQEATAMMHAASERRLDTEQQVKTDLEETIHALQTASEKITTTEAQVSQAQLAAEHARARYENGMATALDLLNTEASLSQAELARLQAAYEYVLNSYSLKRVTGELFW
ncbi:MAG: TolC family protein [Chlorobium sp.]